MSLDVVQEAHPVGELALEGTVDGLLRQPGLRRDLLILGPHRGQDDLLRVGGLLELLEHARFEVKILGVHGQQRLDLVKLTDQLRLASGVALLLGQHALEGLGLFAQLAPRLDVVLDHPPGEGAQQHHGGGDAELDFAAGGVHGSSSAPGQLAETRNFVASDGP